MLSNNFRTAGTLSTLLFMVSAGQVFAQTSGVESVGDFGNSHPSYPPSNAVDGNTAFSSRWAATFDGGSANLWIDLGNVVRIDDVGVAWGRGDSRSYEFEVWAREGTSGEWRKLADTNSSGATHSVEKYNVDDMDARQVRIKVFSNSAGTPWADVTEFEVYDTSGRTFAGSGDNTPAIPPSNPPSNPGNPIAVISIPGRIEAEQFSNYSDSGSSNLGGQFRSTGVDIESCSDSGCGYNVGWTSTGEWLEYAIDVERSGDYEARLRVASTNSSGALSFSIDGTTVTSNVSVSSTAGWQNWRTQSVNLGNLTAGKHTLRIQIQSGGVNINWVDIVESDGQTSSPSPSPTPTPTPVPGNFGLDPSNDPWENFDLRRWSLDSPAPRNDDQCKSERTWDYQWNSSNPLDSSSAPFFFTHSDGGMRFVTRIDGQTTSSSCNSGYVRSELREMLRAGNNAIDDTGVTKNNWKLGYQPGSDSNWGGVNGVMNATLRVNRVTTSGSPSQVGRVIIGQIHAGNDEPLRLYYRKRTGQAKGCIYFGHEIRDSDDVWFDMIGGRDCTSGPSNGIGLDELFSYTIANNDEDLTVTIRRGDRDGPIIERRTIDMNDLNSGYDRSDEWMYFKAGAYTQNNTGKGSDGDTVTFYRLSVSHD